MASQLKESLEKYAYGFYSIVAFLCEARVRQLAAEQVDFFVEGFETSLNDAAIFVGSGTSEPLSNRGGAADTLFVRLHNYRRRKVFGPVDVKRCTPKCDSKKGVQFYIKISPGQRQYCQAFILVSPKEPDFVLLIPFHYLRLKDTVEDGVSLPPIRPLWTLHPLPAFPPEWTSFIFPSAQLGNALENMRAYFDESSDEWGNEYTGANFTGLPRPELFDASVLEPAQGEQQLGRDRVRHYFKAFHEHSTRFSVDLIGVRPFLGDFKIIEISTKQEVFVELKNGISQVIRDGTSGSAVLQHRAQDPQSRRSIFCWKAQWDYLLTVNEAENSAYMLPRDKIPADWWHTSLSPKSFLEMSKDLDKYSIDLSRGVQMVRDIEKVLDTTQKETGFMRAQNVIPIGHSMHEPLDQIGDDLGSDVLDLVSRNRWSTRGFRRGFGSAKHEERRGKTYSVWASEVLIKLCRASGQGLVLDFGIYNPVCRFAIARYLWSKADKVRYDRDGDLPSRVWNLPKNTPVVPLSFLGSSWTGDWQPRGNRNLTSGLPDIARRSSSIVVLDLYPESCLRLRHERFVFASQHLKSSLPRSHRGVLRANVLLDQYYVDSNDLINVITAPLRGESQVRLGHPGTTIQAAHYCHSIQSLHQAGLDAISEARKSKSNEASS